MVNMCSIFNKMVNYTKRERNFMATRYNTCSNYSYSIYTTAFKKKYNNVTRTNINPR